MVTQLAKKSVPLYIGQNSGNVIAYMAENFEDDESGGPAEMFMEMTNDISRALVEGAASAYNWVNDNFSVSSPAPNGKGGMETTIHFPGGRSTTKVEIATDINVYTKGDSVYIEASIANDGLKYSNTTAIAIK